MMISGWLTPGAAVPSRAFSRLPNPPPSRRSVVQFDSTLLLLLVTPQDTPKADTAADRARRAGGDRIMTEPPPPRAVRAAPVEDPRRHRPRRLSSVRQVVVGVRLGQVQKQITLEWNESAQAEDGEDGQPALRARPINIREMALAKENFDSWVFGGEKSEKTMRDHLHSLLSGKIAIHRVGRGLNPEQIEKLRLAGRWRHQAFLRPR